MEIDSRYGQRVWLLGGGVTAVFLLALVLAFPHTPLLPPPADALYRQSSAPLEARVEDLLSYMTLEEKIGQLALVDKNSVKNLSDVSTYGLGAILSGFGAKPEENTPAGWRTMTEQFTGAAHNSRLGIPILYGVDAVHGHSNVPGATVFPHMIGLGATHDEELVLEVARATSLELQATGVNWSYSPNLDLPRDIRWGRTYEAFSDDPTLTARLGAAFVRGTQEAYASGTTGRIAVVSTPKHYIGLGAMLWDTSSNKHFHIDQGITPADMAALRREYLPPFTAAIDAGARSVMVGLNSWDTTKLAAERHLVTTVLKEEVGFSGFTVSDWYGVYEIPGGEYTAAVTALNAGIDMVMLPFDYKPFIKNVSRAVRRGDVAEARIDDAVRRILRVKFELGLFDQSSTTVPLTVVGSAAHRALAREAVARSAVLLRNEGRVLPLRDGVAHIRVAGSAADNIGRQSGAWTVEWQGIDGNALPGATSILAGIQKRAPAGVRVEYDREGNFATDEIADIGIAVVGEAPYAEGWGDRAFPVLSEADRATIARLQKTSRKTVVLLVSGRPLLIEREIHSWDAAVALWLPGSEGEGVADVLFGDRPFTGTLPLPWPLRSEQLPINARGETADGSAPLYPRYYGLR